MIVFITYSDSSSLLLTLPVYPSHAVYTVEHSPHSPVCYEMLKVYSCLQE